MVNKVQTVQMGQMQLSLMEPGLEKLGTKVIQDHMEAPDGMGMMEKMGHII